MGNLAEPDTLGPAIAVAFLATFYGVAFADLLFLPLGSKIKLLAGEEKRYGQMMAEGVIGRTPAKPPGTCGSGFPSLPTRMATGSQGVRSAMARRRRAQESSHGGGGGHGGASGRWLVSYADFIILMMVMFMVLYSMARVDSGKYGKLKASLAHSSIGGAPLPIGGNSTNTAPVKPGPDPESAPGQPEPAEPEQAVPAPPFVLPQAAEPAELEPEPAAEPAKPSGGAQPESAPPVAAKPKPPADPMQPVVNQFRNSAAARAGKLDVSIQDRGVVVTVVTSLLFPPGGAELIPEATAIPDQISAQLKNVNDPIVVEGSPDAAVQNAPWDLSARRASAVVRYLVDNHGLTPDRFAVVGYGKGDGVQGIVNVVTVFVQQPGA